LTLHEESLNRQNGFFPSLKSEEKFQILAEEKLQFELKSVSSPDLHSCCCLPKSEDMRVRERGRGKKETSCNSMGEVETRDTYHRGQESAGL
jgi:hypothetical protein